MKVIKKLGIFLIAASSYYLANFIVLYSIDGTFTRAGGTTPFCHEHPWNGAYEPLTKIARNNGWWGGGELVSLPTKSTVDFDPIFGRL